MAELSVRVVSRTRAPRALALVLHGGKVRSDALTKPWQLAVLRMAPFAAALRRAGGAELAVAMVRFRARGWNADSSSAGAVEPPRVADVTDALAILGERLGDLPTALLGHSMGGRAALLAGGHARVRAVVGVAPWVEANDPVEQLAGRDVLLMHGESDRVTDQRASRALADRAARIGARTSFVGIAGGDHAMLHRARLWHRLAAGYTAAVLLGTASRPGPVADLIREAASGGARITAPK